MKYNNKTLLKGTLALVMATLPSLLFAQKAGDLISGVVEDAQGPLMMVNVTERDAADRIVAYGSTDVEGNFSFRLVNPEDKIVFSYVGYETVKLSIDKTYFEVTMKDQTELEPVVIEADPMYTGSGLNIPTRELPAAVTTIDMEDFKDQSMTTVDEALAGQIPGLDIAFGSGDLGTRSTMHLRGVTTMTGDANPLIVVNGIPWEVDSNLKNNFDYVNESQNTEKVSELLNINPQDIASINVLRDAAATAIWGSKGANGVMEIITKRGSRGKTRVSYSYRLNATWQPIGYTLLNGDQYTMFRKESFFNPHMSDQASDIIELNYDKDFSEYEMYNDNTDWVAAVKQVGMQHSHDLSVSGGGEKADFRISAGFANQEGSVIGQHLNRFTTLVSFDYRVSDRIRISTDFSMTYSKNKQNSTAIGTAMKMMPNLAIYYEDADGESTGEFYHMLPSASDELPDNTNPLAVAAEKQSYSTSLSLSPNFSIRFNLLGMEANQTRLVYDGRINFNVSNNSGDNYTPQSLSKDGWSDDNANSISTNSSKNSSVTTEHTLTFTPYFENTDHSFTMMVRGNVNSSNGKSQNNGKVKTPSGFTSIGSEGTINNMSTSANRSRSMSAVFSSHYSYKGKYNVDFTVRSDGNTKFGDAARWGSFPSASARWNIIDENFMEKIRNQGWLDMLAARVSWGLQGQSPGSDGLYYSKYKSGASYMGQTSMVPDNMRASSIQWQETSSWNGGLNVSVFNGKLSLNVDVYDRLTTKMIQSGYSIPTSSGYSTLPVANDGTMRNQGWERSVSTRDIIKTKLLGKDLRVGGGFNIADNTNQILELNETLLEKMTNDFDYKNGSYLSYVALKNPYGSIYGFKSLGVYQYSKWSEVEEDGVSGPNAPVARDADGNVILVRKNGKDYTRPMMFDYGDGRTNYEFVGGDAIYEDINHDGNINELDIVYLGSSLPKLQGGFNLRVNWGRLSWTNNFSFRYGNRIVNKSRMNAECMYNTDNTSAAINWRWRVEGDDTIMPRALYNYGYNYLGSDRYVEDGSFVRWTSTNLSYPLDQKLVKYLHVQSVNFTLNMNNVLTLTKYSGLDPESAGAGGRGSVAADNSQTPRSKQISFSVNVAF